MRDVISGLFNKENWRLTIMLPVTAFRQVLKPTNMFYFYLCWLVLEKLE